MFFWCMFSCALLLLSISQNTISQTAYRFPRIAKSKDSSVVSDLEKMVVTAGRHRLLDASHSLSVIRAEEWAGTNKV